MSELPPRARPTHYKIICISIYTSSLEDLDQKVDAVKALGHTKFNRSQLIRLAVSSLTVEQIVAALPRQQ